MSTEATTARLLDGKSVARQMRAEVAAGCQRLEADRGVRPGLSVVLVGSDPASAIYVRNKQKAATEVGIKSEVIELSADSAEADILDTIGRLNGDDSVHGILVQLPLPGSVDEHRVIEAIDPAKDVDGFHPVNAGRLLSGLPGLLPCTPAGILEMLKRYEIPLKGRHSVVIGRSNIVGKPMALLLLREHCTVTICHSRTRHLPAVAARADILIAAVGRMGMVTRDFIRPGAVVIDVGIHPVKDEETVRRLFGEDRKRLATLAKRGATLAGDVHPLDARARAGWFSPVPGGVGPLTIAQLLRNTLQAASEAAER